LEEKKKENARGGAGLDLNLVPIEEDGRVGTRGSGQAGPPSISFPPGSRLARRRAPHPSRSHRYVIKQAFIGIFYKLDADLPSLLKNQKVLKATKRACLNRARHFNQTVINSRLDKRWTLHYGY